MGEIHKASLEGVKLEGAAKEHGVIIAFLFGFWMTVFAWTQQKDEKVKSAVLKAAICQWLTTPICFIGWVWAIKWAMAAKAQS